MSDSPTLGATIQETNRALIEGAYNGFAHSDIPAVLEVFADDILWHVPGRGVLSRTITATLEYSASSSISCNFPRARFGFRSGRCSRKATASSCWSRRARPAAVASGLRHKSTRGPSRTERPSSSGNSRATSRLKTNSGPCRCWPSHVRALCSLSDSRGCILVQGASICGFPRFLIFRLELHTFRTLRRSFS